MNVKRKWILVIFISAVTLLITLASSASAPAGDTLCTGSLGAVQVDNLVVPEDAACTLNGTIVGGNLTVRKNATLMAYAVQVSNDVQADDAATVNLYPGSSVGHNLKIVKSGAAEILSVDVDNDLQISENDRAVSVAGSTIGHNLKAEKNTGGVSINSNHIDGNLQCKDNDPPPTGSGNIVLGNLEGQCADFGAVPTPTPTNTPPAPTSTPVIDQEAPSVQWIEPVLAGEQYDIREGQQVILEAQAWDNATIAQVTFFRWDAVNLEYVTIGTLNQAPFRINIQAGTLNPEWNQIFVTASDAAGNQSDHPFIWLYKLAGGEMDHLIFLPITGK
ncbi:MAG: hypothetical protein P8Z00_14005 [Anaerolineales bacterium]|jgi:hypothetical protein